MVGELGQRFDSVKECCLTDTVLTFYDDGTFVTCVSDEVLNLSERKIFVHDESSNRKKIDVMRTPCPHPFV